MWKSRPIAVLQGTVLLGACVVGGVLTGRAALAPWWHAVVWAGLMPFAWLLRPGLPWFLAAVGALIGGTVYHMAGLWFLSVCVAGVLAPVWFFASIGGGLCCALAFLAGRQAARRTGWPAAVVLPMTWTTFEWLRYWGAAAVLGEPFTLLWLGQAIVDDRHLVQLADLGGVAMLGGLIAAVNGALAGLLNKSTKIRKCLRRPWPAGKWKSRWQNDLCIRTGRKLVR